MEQTILTCEQVDERDLEAGYLSGRLSEEDAIAFESHFFGCERCWTLLQNAQTVAAARPAVRALVRRPRWFAPSLAAAALALLVAGGLWVTRPSQPVPTETLRGAATAITTDLHADPQGVAGRFGAVVGADRYRVRVFSDAGGVLAEKEITDTNLLISLARVPGGAPATVLVEVTALDALRQPLATSGLVPVHRSPSR